MAMIPWVDFLLKVYRKKGWASYCGIHEYVIVIQYVGMCGLLGIPSASGMETETTIAISNN